MVLGYRVHNHKAKLKEDTNNDKFGPMQNPVITEYHKSMKSNFGVTKKRVQRILNQGNIDSDI